MLGHSQPAAGGAGATWSEAGGCLASGRRVAGASVVVVAVGVAAAAC